MSADRWGELTRLIVACALERPERIDAIDVDQLARGPARDVAVLMRRRAAAGLATDAVALRGLDAVRQLGPIVTDLAEEPIVQSRFAAYALEARQLAARDGPRARAGERCRAGPARGPRRAVTRCL